MIISTTFANEADIQIREGPSNSFDWQNPGTVVFTSFDYDSSQELTGDFAGGVDPGVGPWEVEFFDTFDDGPGADSQSINVEMTFEERLAITDSNGVFSLGSLNVGGTKDSVGEFALPNLYDLYTITLNEAGLFTFFTGADPNGFVGKDVDTEIAIFDSAGDLVAENDDISDDIIYSGIFDLSLAAGDYTLAVTAWDATFADGFAVNPGPDTGDYIVNASLVSIPEPGSLAFLGFGGLGLFAFRRRK